MSDTPPKLRIVDDEAPAAEEVPRLGGEAPEGVARLKVREPEESGRTGGEKRGHHDGRSAEPVAGPLPAPPAVGEEIETPWGLPDGRVAGVPYGWFVLVALLLAAALVWSLVTAGRGESHAEVAVQQALRTVEEDAAADAEASRLVDRVEEVLRAYMAAETVEEMLPLVRHPERVKPLLEDWLGRHPRSPVEVSGVGSFRPSPLERFWLVPVQVAGGLSQHVQLEQVGDTEVKVDWESHVCYQPMPWDDFAAGRPDDRALDFRVWVTPDHHFSHEFSDTRRWVCYRLMAKDAEEWLYGYVAAGSEMARQIDLAVRSSTNGQAPFFLRLRVPVGTVSPRGVVIESVLAQGWTVREDPSKDGP